MGVIKSTQEQLLKDRHNFLTSWVVSTQGNFVARLLLVKFIFRGGGDLIIARYK